MIYSTATHPHSSPLLHELRVLSGDPVNLYLIVSGQDIVSSSSAHPLGIRFIVLFF